MRRLVEKLGRSSRVGRCIGGLILWLAVVSTADGQGRYPYGDFGYGVPPSPWTPSWYFRAEYVAMWATGTRLPPLVTTSPDGTPREDAGVLDVPATSVLLGDERRQDQGRNGGRMTLGHWFDLEQKFALEVQYWVLGEANAEDSIAASTQGTILARPFFNAKTGQEDSQLISFPQLVSGTVSAEYRSEVHSVDILGRYNWLEGPQGYVNLLAGYRFFRFREALEIDERLLEQLRVTDKFIAENDFHGLDLGATFGVGYRCCLLDVTTKIALGSAHHQLKIRGRTSVADIAQSGGWLAASSNLGSHDAYAFAAIPEFEAKFTYVVVDSIRLSVGYNVLCITNAIRVGESMDTTVNPDQLASLPLARNAGPPSDALRPAPRLDETSIWMQGIIFGVEVRW